MISHDGLQLEEYFQCFLIESEFLVAKAEIVERFHARSIVVQRHRVKLPCLFCSLQVRSLNSVGFLQSRIGEKDCAFYKHNLDLCQMFLTESALSGLPLTLCPCEVLEAIHEVRVLAKIEKPIKPLKPRRGRNEKEQCPP